MASRFLVNHPSRPTRMEAGTDPKSIRLENPLLTRYRRVLITVQPR